MPNTHTHTHTHAHTPHINIHLRRDGGKEEHAETKERQHGSKPARVNYPYEFTVLKLLKKKKKKVRVHL